MPETLVPERAATTIALARVGDRDDRHARRHNGIPATPCPLEQLLAALEARLAGELYTIQCMPHTVVVMTYSARSGTGATIAEAVAELLDVLGPARDG